MKISERHALGQWLCDYPSNKTYAEIIETMAALPNDWTHENLELWEVVETYPLAQVAQFIEDTREMIEKAIAETLEAAQ